MHVFGVSVAAFGAGPGETDKLLALVVEIVSMPLGKERRCDGKVSVDRGHAKARQLILGIGGSVSRSSSNDFPACREDLT